MRLETYLTTHSLTPAAFARKCGLSPSTITRLLAGERSPRFELLQLIHDETDGAVAPNDFLREPAKEPSQ